MLFIPSAVHETEILANITTTRDYQWLTAAFLVKKKNRKQGNKTVLKQTKNLFVNNWNIFVFHMLSMQN